MDLTKEISDELVEGEVVHAGTYPPFYTAAAGAHFLNMLNKRMRFHWKNRRVMDLRIHPILVAPPGFSKSFFIHQYMRKPYGVLTGAGIKLMYQQSITAAGMVGTGQKTRDGVVSKSIGEAQEHKTAIFGCEEFQGLLTKSSGEMVEALLQLLDDGHLVKRVAAIKHDYQTYITLFGGAQVDHFNLSRGLFRRLTVMVFIPTKADEEALIDAYFAGGGRSYNRDRLRKIRAGYRVRVKQSKLLKKINISNNFEKWARRRKIIHYEIPLYERLVIGHNIMKKAPDNGVLDCTLDRQLVGMLNNQYKWRKSLKRDLRENMVLERVLDEGEVKISSLFLQLADLGMELEVARSVADKLVKKNMLLLTDKGTIKANIGERNEKNKITTTASK